VNASLFQLKAAARLPCSGISEIALNAVLAVIEAAAPKDEIEGSARGPDGLHAHSAMAVLARLGGGAGSEQRVAALGSAPAARLGELITYQPQPTGGGPRGRYRPTTLSAYL
jgi:hypothetical protein